LVIGLRVIASTGLYEIRNEIHKQKNNSQAVILQRFFKTGKGEYGEGDVFFGIKVPVQRKIVKSFKNLPLDDIKVLIHSPIHEERLIATLILVEQFKKADSQNQKIIFDFYLKNSKGINNWDLVDLSAPNIIGTFLLDKDKSLLYKFAESINLWERRIAILSTFTFIRDGNFNDALKISEILLHDKHDLIHKATGWMLREVGNRNMTVEEKFLRKYYKVMPRTMLRYAIEKFPETKRKKYLEGKI
jgi:3-methyladenine DNA glycosylase AlkD